MSSADTESRRKAGLVVVAIVLVVVVVALGYLLVKERQRPDEWQQELTGPVQPLVAVAYDPEGQYLAAGSGSGDAVVWDLTTGESKLLTKLTDRSIVSLGVSPDRFLVAGDANHNLLGWQLDSDEAKQMSSLGGVVTSIAFRQSPASGPEMALGLNTRQLVLLSGAGTKTVATEHRGGVRRVAYSPNGRWLVTGGTDGQLVWFDTQTRKPVVVVSKHSAEIGALCFSPDGTRLASGDWNGHLLLCDATTRRTLAERNQPDAVSGLAWLPQSPLKLLASGWDGVLRIYAADLKNQLHQIDTGRTIHDVALSPDGRMVATASGGRTLELWRVGSDSITAP